MNAARCANVVNSIPVAVNLVQGSCCFTQGCSCINFAFLKTAEGILKLAEILLGVACQKLLIGYGFTYSTSLGSSYYSFLTTVSANVLTSLVLLMCYLVSHQEASVDIVIVTTLMVLRLQEIIFNGISSFLYLTSSCYLVFAIYTFLYPIYKITSIFQVYPEMSVTYIVGFMAGIIHGYDSWLAYKKYN